MWFVCTKHFRFLIILLMMLAEIVLLTRIPVASATPRHYLLFFLSVFIFGVGGKVPKIKETMASVLCVRPSFLVFADATWFIIYTYSYFIGTGQTANLARFFRV